MHFQIWTPWYSASHLAGDITTEETVYKDEPYDPCNNLDREVCGRIYSRMYRGPPQEWNGFDIKSIKQLTQEYRKSDHPPRQGVSYVLQ